MSETSYASITITDLNDKYTYIRYSSSPDGSNFSSEPNKYIGICTVESETAPTDPAEYEWSQLIGDNVTVTKTETSYQVSSSNTEKPTGTWYTENDGIPTTDSVNKYLWTRVVITFSDSSTTEAYSISSTMDSIEIGGANLISNIGTNWSNGNWSIPAVGGTTSISNYSGRVSLNEYVEVVPKSSYWVKIYSSKTVNALFRLLDSNKKYLSSITGITDQEWVCPSNCYYIAITIYENSSVDDITNGTTKIKLEKGNVSTDYTPSNEDTTSEINGVKSVADSASQSITNEVWRNTNYTIVSKDSDGNDISTTKTLDSILSGIYADINGVIVKVENNTLADIDDDLSLITRLGKVETTSEKIELLVKSGTSESDLVLTDGAITAISNNINLTGKVNFNALASDLSGLYTTENNTTVINGAKIKTGSIDADSLTVEKLSAISTNLGDIVGGSITIGNGVFAVTDKGVLTATSGKVGGWTIGSSSIYNGLSSYGGTTSGIYIGTDGIESYKSTDAYVKISDGKIESNNADISGTITAKSGTIGGCSISDGVLKIKEANIDGTISATKINADNLASINADLGTVTAGTIDASKVTITNLNASNITSGTINSDRISVENLSAISTNLGSVVAGQINIGNGVFVVTTGGALTATSAKVTGEITATSGKIGAWNISKSGNSLIGYGDSPTIELYTNEENAGTSNRIALINENGLFGKNILGGSILTPSFKSKSTYTTKVYFKDFTLAKTTSPFSSPPIVVTCPRSKAPWNCVCGAYDITKDSFKITIKNESSSKSARRVNFIAYGFDKNWSEAEYHDNGDTTIEEISNITSEAIKGIDGNTLTVTPTPNKVTSTDISFNIFSDETDEESSYDITKDGSAGWILLFGVRTTNLSKVLGVGGTRVDKNLTLYRTNDTDTILYWLGFNLIKFQENAISKYFSMTAAKVTPESTSTTIQSYQWGFIDFEGNTKTFDNIPFVITSCLSNNPNARHSSASPRSTTTTSGTKLYLHNGNSTTGYSTICAVAFDYTGAAADSEMSDSLKYIDAGSVYITPTAANSPTSADITFNTSFDNPPIVIISLGTGYPDRVTCSTSNITTDGFKGWINRTNTTSTEVQWLAIDIASALNDDVDGINSTD